VISEVPKPSHTYTKEEAMRLRLLVRPIALLAGLLVICIVAPCAGAVPLAPDPSGSTHAVHVYTASDPAPDHRMSKIGDCVDGKPTVTIFFSAKGTGQVRVTAQRTTSTVNVKPADVYWSQLVDYPKEDEIVPVPYIAAPLDDSEFHVFITAGAKDTSGPGHVVLSATHTTCEMPLPPEGLKATNPPSREEVAQQVTDWAKRNKYVLAVVGLLCCIAIAFAFDRKPSA
jgi:hypothetical protein